MKTCPKCNHQVGDETNFCTQWEDLVIFKDGVANDDMGYGINGFLLRRIYLDNIPFPEIEEKLSKLLIRLKAVDNSKNAPLLCRYTINNEIVYCIGAEQNYFMSISTGKRYNPYDIEHEIQYYPNVVECKANNGQNFYNIYNYRWCSSTNKVAILDKCGNIVYIEKNINP